MDTTPKYPNVTVQLTGKDGNAFAILGRVQRAMRAADIPENEVKGFSIEAMSGDYDHLLATVARWVDVN